MSRRSARASVGARLLALLVVATAPRPAGADDFAAGSDERPPVPAALKDVGIDEHLGRRVPLDLAFADEAGRPTTLRAALAGGRPVVLTLAYFQCPMLCSLVLNGVAAAAASASLRPGVDYRLVTVSFDPDDTPRVAAERQRTTLAQLPSARAADWPFLTAAAPAAPHADAPARALADALGFRYAYDRETRQFAHAAAAFVLTPDGTISRYLYGARFEPRDLKLALVEASGGRVGTSFDRALLYCYRYDPALRRYGLFVFGFLRTGALLVFLALGLVLARYWRRELAAARAAGGAR